MKIAVGIVGATGMVGQRFATLLEDHPWFEVQVVAASHRSAGKTYEVAVGDRWVMERGISAQIKSLIVLDAVKDIEIIASKVAVVFSALDMDKVQIKKLEEAYAAAGVAVISNNSAHRWTEDVPMIMPEINPQHADLIKLQREVRGWNTGCIVVKPNCSLQSYLPIIHALAQFEPSEIEVTTLQAISGAGKTFASWPEMLDNCIPYIGGEEEKTEKEPLKILGTIRANTIQLNQSLNISATCIRVPVQDGHMASVAVRFKNKPTLDEVRESILNYQNPIRDLQLPSAPNQFIRYFEENDRPQTNSDRNQGNGMGISCGRLREDSILDWKFISLSHNTIRGAAGGAILAAELLKAQSLI